MHERIWCDQILDDKYDKFLDVGILVIFRREATFRKLGVCQHDAHTRFVDISSGDVNWSHPHLGVQKEIAVTSIPKPHATMLRCLIGPVVLKSDGQVHQGVIHKVRKTCWSCCVSKTPVLKEITQTLPEIEKWGVCDSWIGLQFQEKSSTWVGIVFLCRFVLPGNSLEKRVN